MSELLQYSGQYYRKPPQGDVEFQHLWKVMDDIQAAMRNAGLSEAQIAALLGGYVQSVTGLDTDNTDPQNPVVQIAVDGVTITGDGTPGNPLVSSGGGGTPSAPDGSVQFNDGGSFGGEADLYWDKVQDRLGIGTDTPECTLDVRSGGTTNTRGVQVTHYDNTTAFSQAKFIGRRSRGSVGSPSAVQADDTLASFNARGRHNTGWSNTVGGAYIYAANNWTNTSTGTYLTWRGVPTGSTTVAEWMRLNQSGLRLASLAGVGTRMVVADTNGDLSTQAIPSAPDASTTVKGVTKLSVAPVLASNPIAVGDNDPRNSDARTPTAHAATHTNGTDDIQTASALQKGLLSSADWSTFNGKQPVATGTPNGTKFLRDDNSWQNVPDATLVVSGVVNTGAQTIGGDKTFQGNQTVKGNILSSTGATNQGTLIIGSNATRYTSNTGINTSAIYNSAISTTADVFVSYVFGGISSNIYVYIQSSGYFGTRGAARLGSPDGTTTLTAITNTWLKIHAGTTARSQINLTASTAPSSPLDGDVWYDGTQLKMRFSSVTETILGDTFTDGLNLTFGTTTGTKIGTATSQKIGFWNAAPIVQPTTAVAAATLVGGGGTTITDTDTFDGYTIQQIVKALRNTGLLA